MGTFFICYQSSFCSFVATCLCQYYRRYWLIFKYPIECRYPENIQLFNPYPIYSFTLDKQSFLYILLERVCVLLGHSLDFDLEGNTYVFFCVESPFLQLLNICNNLFSSPFGFINQKNSSLAKLCLIIFFSQYLLSFLLLYNWKKN